MYNHTNKRIFTRVIASLIIFSILALCFPVSAQGNESYSWYCIRAKDHKRPGLDATLSWIKDPSLQAYYIDPDCTDEDNEQNRILYLTFDVGYENGNVSKVLDTLKEKKVCGSFFILKNVIERENVLLERMFEEGHLVCNHTASHPDMSKIKDQEKFAKELETLDKLCFEKTGRHVARYYRPPQGCFNRQNLQWASELGYRTVFWSFAYADWDNDKQPDPQASLEKIMSNIHNGAILLLHPTSSTNAQILGDVIDRCLKMGYRFETLENLKAVEENREAVS